MRVNLISKTLSVCLLRMTHTHHHIHKWSHIDLPLLSNRLSSFLIFFYLSICVYLNKNKVSNHKIEATKQNTCV